MSTLNTINYRNYWFETATPSFLVKLMQQKQYFMPELEGLTVTDSSLSSFDVETIPLTTLLFQTGYPLQGEDVTNIGRIDLSINMPDKVILLEFKLKKYGNANEAIEQIKTRGYADKFKHLNKPIYLVGMSFDPTLKNITDYCWEQL